MAARPRGACRTCGQDAWGYGQDGEWFCHACLEPAPGQARKRAPKEDERDDQDGFWEPAQLLITELYRKARLEGAEPQPALRAACDKVLADVPELDLGGLGLAVLSWTEESGQRDFDTYDGPRAIAKAAWSAVAATRPPKPKRRRRRRPARLPFRYAPFPLQILHDVTLSTSAKLVAAAIASTINLGRWNARLETTASYDRLAALASVSRRWAVHSVRELEDHGYIEREGRGRAGTRFRFTDKIAGNSARRALFMEKKREWEIPI